MNSEAAESSLDRIVQIMAENLDWSKKRIQVSGGLDVPGDMGEVECVLQIMAVNLDWSKKKIQFRGAWMCLGKEDGGTLHHLHTPTPTLHHFSHYPPPPSIPITPIPPIPL